MWKHPALTKRQSEEMVLLEAIMFAVVSFIKLARYQKHTYHRFIYFFTHLFVL